MQRVGRKGPATDQQQADSESGRERAGRALFWGEGCCAGLGRCPRAGSLLACNRHVDVADRRHRTARSGWQMASGGRLHSRGQSHRLPVL